MSPARDIDASLRRDDKWFLGGGRLLAWAPPFPVHLDAPGFWDEAHLVHLALAPGFAVTVLDAGLRPVAWRTKRRRWQPSHLALEHAAAGWRLSERRAVVEGDALAVELDLTGPESAVVVTWTAQPASAEAPCELVEASPGRILLRRALLARRGPALPAALALGMTGAGSFAVQSSEHTSNLPDWRLTPFYETAGPDGLPGTVRTAGISPYGLIYAGVAATVPSGRARLVAALGVNPEEAGALAALAAALATSPVERSRAAWREWFESVPDLGCDDPYLETAYWYRWFGLRLATILGGAYNFPHPVVTEGISYFRMPISYSAQAHAREVRWHRDPALGAGIFRTFARHQAGTGILPAHVMAGHVEDGAIYHADWGGALRAFLQIHPDADLAREWMGVLRRYADYFDRERDREGISLYDHVNQWESGQEYMSRYLFVDETGDEWRPLARRLKGVDATVYQYATSRAAAALARANGADPIPWLARAERIGRAVRERMWDPATLVFRDLAPDGRPNPGVYLTSLYPLATSITGVEHLGALERYLVSPEHFWTPFPAPASSRSDPYYCAEPNWKGRRHNCPWNGRVWPMTNSHVAEILARASRLQPAWRDVLAEFLGRHVRMLFWDQDPARPNCFEHYHPETGQPSAYRGIDDYMHSWLADLILRFAAGIQPADDRVVLDPLPLCARVELAGAMVRGHRLDVRVARGRTTAWLDGQRVARAADGAVTLPLARA
jgi:hypothetical protein